MVWKLTTRTNIKTYMQWSTCYKPNYPILFLITFLVNSSFQLLFRTRLFDFFYPFPFFFSVSLFSPFFFSFSLFSPFYFLFSFLFLIFFQFLLSSICFVSIWLYKCENCFNSPLYICPLPPSMYDEHTSEACMCSSQSKQLATTFEISHFCFQACSCITIFSTLIKILSSEFTYIIETNICIVTAFVSHAPKWPPLQCDLWSP